MNPLDLIQAAKDRRAKAGLVAANGVHCRNTAELIYRNFRHEMEKRPDWGNLPADMLAKLVKLKKESTK